MASLQYMNMDCRRRAGTDGKRKRERSHATAAEIRRSSSGTLTSAALQATGEVESAVLAVDRKARSETAMGPPSICQI